MLTTQDLDKIKILLDYELDEKLEEKFNEKLKYLPSKDDFYKMMDKLFGEQEIIRNEQTLSAHSQQDYEKRLEKLEKIHPQNKHAFIAAS